ncbi:MAG: diaminopimelate epimerase [Bdellovibrionaceae bacterium]|nr:diaminopimelate epimerase [Bdellovibrio sp.]
MKISTQLISGAGNTFHITWANQNPEIEKLSAEQKKKIAADICDRNKADGFIFLKKESTYSWWFYNNDGSDAEMCGNATRCVGYFIKNIIGEDGPTWNLLTTAGPIKIEALNSESYKISMTPIETLNSSHGAFYDTGVPHLIQELERFGDYLQKKSEAATLRFHKDFQPRGTNVTYVQLENEANRLKAVSYERGVENFTDACGTGAMAAAMYNLIKRGSQQTQVEMPGGTLMMDLSDLKNPQMTGPAVLLGTFEYEI